MTKSKKITIQLDRTKIVETRRPGDMGTSRLITRGGHTLKDKISHIIKLSFIDVTCDMCDMGHPHSRYVQYGYISSGNVLISHCGMCDDALTLMDASFKVNTLDLKCDTICSGDACNSNFKIAHAGLTHDKKLVALCESIIYSDDIKDIPCVKWDSDPLNILYPAP